MYKVQSILIDKSKYTLEEAIKFIDKHFKLKKIDETERFYRFRQINPATLMKQGYTRPITKRISDGIELIIYYS